MNDGGDRHGGASHDRRRFIAGLAGGAGVLATGCLGDPLGGEPTPARTPDQFAGPAMEVLHGWTGRDGADAIRSVERMFRARHPDVRIDFRPIGGTGNENLNSAVDRRLANGNPPATWATWPGPTLAQYDGRLLDLTDVWEDHGFTEAIHGRVGEYCRRHGGYRAVPIGSHRVNNLFFNVSVLEAAGVDPEDLDSVDALLDALDAVERRTDAVPMAHAMQAPWPTLQLVAAVVLSESGAGGYRDLVTGNGRRSVLVSALDTMRTLLERYINDDASTVSYTTANRKLVRDEAATIVQGSWVYDMYRTADSMEYHTDWDCMAFPGTGGIYGLNLDAFVFPLDNPAPQKSDLWAGFVGQADPQVAFSNRKGSVPVRTDVDATRLAAFPRDIWLRLLGSPELVPTLAHGLAVDPDTLAACKAAIRDSFVGPFEVERTADALLAALAD
jgi:glucose/mannose transport system substrate-binding protein